ncbi:MAG TPA: reductive dehalogenase [Thermoleophilia bacterium]|nr:reductive dehalogenase [Thermoleophilia bacterium]
MRPPLIDVRSLRIPGAAEVLRQAARKTSSGLTTPATGPIARADARHTGYALARAGAWGPTLQREIEASQRKEPLAAALGSVNDIFSTVRDGAVSPRTAPLPDPAALSAHIKSAARFLKADLAGICELPQWAIYARDWRRDAVVCDQRYAIVLVSEWDYDSMDASTGDDWISLAESNVAYNQSALIACTLAEYIRDLGYPARAHFQGTFDPPCYDVVVTPLLLLAGLGELSRPGWALNPLLGGRFKASVVTTDLPLAPDEPVDFGLQEFCRVCKRCARQCPSGAISDADAPVPHNGYLAYEFDPERCGKYRITNRDGAWCGRCVKVCPWNKPEGLVHDLVRLAAARAPRIDPLWVTLDEWLGYGRPRPERQWWLGLERAGEGFRRAGRDG